MDFDISSEREGKALTIAESYRTMRPSRRSKAPLKPVPSHLRAKKRGSRPLILAPAIPMTKIPDWLRRQVQK